VGIIRKYERWLAHWESGRDGGQYAAVQKGFDRSSGEIMAWLNSDDLYFPWTFKTVGEIFLAFPKIQWLTTSITAITSASNLPLMAEKNNYSRRWFYWTRGKRFAKSGYIQQEATFWRRTLLDRTGSSFDTSLKYAGDHELWSRFYRSEVPVAVNIPLAMFRIQPLQKTARMEEYSAEANRILARFLSPVTLPRFFIHVMNYIYRRTSSQANWLSTRSDKVTYDLRSDKWIYIRFLEWRY
jgi:hypothetical protein